MWEKFLAVIDYCGTVTAILVEIYGVQKGKMMVSRLEFKQCFIPKETSSDKSDLLGESTDQSRMGKPSDDLVGRLELEIGRVWGREGVLGRDFLLLSWLV
jgi:hypothetical protein